MPPLAILVVTVAVVLFLIIKLRINAFGALSGLMVGVGLGCLMEWRDATLKSELDVQAVIGAPLLGLIPALTTTADIQARRRKRVMIGLATAGTLGVVAVGIFAVLSQG